MTKIIGLTGGIGSGKSTIANHFLALGIPVYIADDEAKKITNSLETLNSIELIFGKSVFENNILNRKKLAEIVFNDAEKLKLLNDIIHPLVKKHFDNWLLKHATYKMILKESALLFETKSNKHCDFVISILAPLEARIDRVIKRDNLSHQEVLIRLNNQWTDKQRIEKSDFIINNDILENAIQQADAIFNQLNLIIG
jgi:dephospho-CoA kinase